MEKQKIYIFLIHTIYTIGGTQMYMLGKARYLHSLGWRVYAFLYDDDDEGVFHDAEEYLDVVKDCFFLSVPPYRLKRGEQDLMLDQMLRSVSVTETRNRHIEDYIWDLSQPKIYKNADTIVETFFPNSALWGELLAARVNGRHFFCGVQENYRYWGNLYEDNLDFFYFKWKRNEIFTGEELLRDLFNGYKGVDKFLVEMPDTVREQDAIQNVVNPKIEAIQKADWNICHIGRIEKDYVAHVIAGVAELAQRHLDKKINFIFVGDESMRRELLHETFENLPNVHLIFLGILAPIPRSLFSKVDVVCAISQTARFTANDGVLTIVASANYPEGTPGVLGYDTKEQICGEPTFTYFEAFENALVNHAYDDKQYNLPKLEPAEHYYENFWTILKNADPNKEYFVDRISQDRIRQWVAVFPFGSIVRGSKIIFYGATEIAKDFRKQIECQQFNVSIDFGLLNTKKKQPKKTPIEISPNGVRQLDDQPYCQLLAVVDEHPENFDNSVMGLDRLKTLDYDGIVITAYSWEVQKAIDKIMELVPQMANRIVYNHRFFDLYTDHHRSVKYIGLW